MWNRLPPLLQIATKILTSFMKKQVFAFITFASKRIIIETNCSDKHPLFLFWKAQIFLEKSQSFFKLLFGRISRVNRIRSLCLNLNDNPKRARNNPEVEFSRRSSYWPLRIWQKVILVKLFYLFSSFYFLYWTADFHVYLKKWPQSFLP